LIGLDAPSLPPLFLSIEERRRPGSCSSLRSSGEPHAGFTTVVLGCLTRTSLGVLPVGSLPVLAAARVGVVGPTRARGARSSRWRAARTLTAAGSADRRVERRDAGHPHPQRCGNGLTHSDVSRVAIPGVEVAHPRPRPAVEVPAGSGADVGGAEDEAGRVGGRAPAGQRVYCSRAAPMPQPGSSLRLKTSPFGIASSSLTRGLLIGCHHTHSSAPRRAE
jgi:hypothetical protein